MRDAMPRFLLRLVVRWIASELEPDAARELAARGLLVAQVASLPQPVTQLEEIGREIGAAEVDAEPLEHACTLERGASVLPEGTSLPGTGLSRAAGGEAEPAGLARGRVHANQRTVSLRWLSSGAWPTIVIT